MLRALQALRPPYRLGTVILLTTSAVLLVLASAYAALTYSRLASETLHTAQQSAESIAQLVVGSHAEALRQGNYASLQTSLQEVLKLRGVEKITLFQPNGDAAMEMETRPNGVRLRLGSHLHDEAVAEGGQALQNKADGQHYIAWASTPDSAVGAATWVQVVYSLQEREQQLHRLWQHILLATMVLAALVLGSLHIIVRKVLQPLRTLTDFSAQIHTQFGGRLDLPSSCVEVRDLCHAVNQASQGIAAEVGTMQAIVNTASEAIIGLDAHGYVVSTNPSAQSMFGRSAEEIVGHPIGNCLPGLDAEALNAMFGQGMEHAMGISRMTRYDLSGYRADGTPFPVEVSLGEVKQNRNLRYACIVRDLTDERAAQETSELYERALASSHNAVFITNSRMDNQPIVYINDAFQRFTGLPRFEILGESMEILRGSNAEDPGIAELSLAMQEQRATNVTIHRMLADGKLQIAEVSLAPVRSDKGVLTHFVGIASDITARVQAEEAMSERRAQLDAIFSLSPDGFVMFDNRRHMVFANPAVEHMTGLVWPDQRNVTLSAFEAQLLALCDPTKEPPVLSTESEEGSWRARLEITRPQPSVIDAQARRNENGRGETILYFRDITHEDAVDRMKSEFLTAAAHELRTPMVSIFGFTELLLRRKFSEERQADMLGTIHKQSGLLIKMLNELLDLARIESRGGQDMRIAAHTISEVVHNSIQGLMLKPTDRTVDLGPLPEDAVLIDPEKMQLALGNLLANAFKYSPQGGKVSLTAHMEDKDQQRFMVIEVTDRGIGMKPEQLSRAFERFYRADASGNIPGTGLGLSLVKEIMELHKGSVTLDSVFGAGTVARLRVPAA